MIVPSLRRERSLWNAGVRRIAGVDEVGVAPTSGAVVAAAVIMNAGCRRIPGVRDSKTLSAAQRERLYPIIRRRAVAVGVGAASVPEIDRLNIYHASHLAMVRAFASLSPQPAHALVDGNVVPKGLVVPAATAIVKGDQRSLSIACASVIAKVWRDKHMEALDASYPGYGFGAHKGYGTPAHLRALDALGPSVLHRGSFAPVAEALGRVALRMAETALGGLGG